MARILRALGWRILPALLLCTRLVAADVGRLEVSSDTITSTPQPSPTPYSNSSCPNDCGIVYPSVYEYTWSSVAYEASTTTEITVATLVVVINDADNSTSTSTELVESTVTQGLETPGATHEGTVTVEGITATVAYPTPYFDYGLDYTIEYGTLLTQRLCQTYDIASVFSPNRHPVLPTPSADLTTDPADTLGVYYTLVPVADASYPDFDQFYQSAFIGQSGVASCTVVSSAAASDTTAAQATETSNAPVYSSPNALTHTSVSWLTATTTKHTSFQPTAQSDQSSPTPTSSWTGPIIGVSHTNLPATPTYVGSTPVVVVDGHTISVGGGRVDVHGTPVRLTVISTNGAPVTECIVGYGGGAFGGAVQSSIPVTWPTQAPQVGVDHTSYDATPTLIGTIPAVIIDGQTVSLGGGRVNVHGTPVRVTVYETGGSTVTGAVIGFGGGAFGGAVQTTVPFEFTTTGQQISACETQIEITPTYISSTPMAVVSDVWLSVNGPSSEVCGTPVRVTAVATTESGHATTVTQALIGYGGGAFGGLVQSTVSLTWGSALATATGKGDLGNYINSGLGGGISQTGTTTSANPTSTQFRGMGAPVATAASSGSIFGLVVAGVVGLLI